MLIHAMSRYLGFAALLVAAVPQASAQGVDLAPPEKKAGEWIDQWAEFIRPSSDELSYESIGWRNEFWPAVQLAQELGRPILLWTMNGHPLGCT